MFQRARILKVIDKGLQKVIAEELPVLKKIKAYVRKSGGKRIRPLLHYTVAKLLRCEAQEWVDVGVVGELIHMASLLHDDVIDDASIRRSRLSPNVVYGNKVSILSGDYILACALQHLSINKYAPLLLPLFSRAIRKLALGELIQMREENEKKIILSTSLKNYERIILCKTSSLFGAMTESAYILAKDGKSDAHESLSYRRFGENLGRVFQIRDDFLDYYASTSKPSGKELYQDFKKGLMTRPLFVLLQRSKPKQAAFLLDSLQDAKKRRAEETIKTLQELLQSAGVRRKLEQEIEEGIHALMRFVRKHEPSAYRSLLLEELRNLLL